MNKLLFAASICFVALISLNGSASADIVYSEDANGLTAGTDTLNTSTGWSGPAGDYDVVAGGAVFTDNHFELTAPDANFNFANWGDGTNRDVLTFSIDLVDLGTGAATDRGVRLSSRRETGSAFTNVLADSIADNTIVHYDVVINTSAAAVTYEDGVSSIAANTLEVWIDGVLSTTGTAGGSGQNIGFGLWNRRPDSAFLADNIVIRDMAFNSAVAVPEPSSVSLVCLLGLGLLRRKRSV